MLSYGLGLFSKLFPPPGLGPGSSVSCPDYAFLLRPLHSTMSLCRAFHLENMAMELLLPQGLTLTLWFFPPHSLAPYCCPVSLLRTPFTLLFLSALQNPVGSFSVPLRNILE